MSAYVLNPSAQPPSPAPGTYKLVVRSADEAVRAIRDRLGENARVLAVRQVEGQGIGSLFTGPRFEVIAEVPAPAAPVAAPAPVSSTADAGVGLDDSMRANTARVEPRPGHGSARVTELLRRAGLSEGVVTRLQAGPALRDPSRPLHQVLADVRTELMASFKSRPARPLPAATAFIGTAGSGRTTALCKWLAREVFAQGRTGRVVKAEFDRPNPADGLAVFCEVLGLSLEHDSASASTAMGQDRGTTSGVLRASTAGGFHYADLPALSLRNPVENVALGRYLDDAGIKGRVIVLNAAYEASVLRRALSAGRELGVTHVVFTHLDEVEQWGKLWELLVVPDVTPLFLATGPGLTGDLEEDVAGAVLRRLLPVS